MGRAEDEKVEFTTNVLTLFIIAMERCYPKNSELSFKEYMKAVNNNYEGMVEELKKKTGK